MNKKLIWGIVIVVVAIVAGIYIYLSTLPIVQLKYTNDQGEPVDGIKNENNLVATSTSLNTAISNWKTYTDVVRRLNFKYPPGYELSEDTNIPANHEFSLTLKSNTDNVYIAAIKIPDPTWTKDGEHICDIKTEWYGCKSYKLEKTTTIDGRVARFVSLDGEGGASRRIQIVDSGRVIEIYTSSKIIDIEKIAKSFNFTN